MSLETKVPLSVIAISGSLSPNSKTALLVDHVLSQLGTNGIDRSHVRLQDLPADALLSADCRDRREVKDIEAGIAQAHGVIIATPIYKSSYSGILKAFLDALPQFAFAGKTILPLATGGSLAHVLALDYGLRPVLHSMGARHVVQSHFVLDRNLGSLAASMDATLDGEAPLYEAIRHFRYSLCGEPITRLQGHPRPSEAMV